MEKETKTITLHKDLQLEYYCEECNKIIDPTEVNIKNSMAKCKDCNSLFSLEEEEFEKRRRGHPIFLVPEGTEVLKLITNLEISSSWLRATKKDRLKFDFIMATAFGLISPGALILGLMSKSILLSFVGVVFVIAALLMAYVVLANILNKTYVIIEEDYLTISHKPLKIFTVKNHKIAIDNIDQLFVAEYATNRSVNKVALKAFGLFIKLKNGKKIKIIDEMNKETSLYIEQEIEEFLEIKDTKMKREISRQ